MEAELRDEVQKLKHIEWLLDNIEKYDGKMKRQLAGRLRESVEGRDEAGAKNAYMDFIENFLLNPYKYVCRTIEYGKEKIVSRYPECYFVEREGEYLPVGFLVEYKERYNGKLTKEERRRLLWGDLRRAKNSFWVEEYCQKERIYLENGYDCYADEWEKQGADTGREAGGSGEKEGEALLHRLLPFLLLAAIMGTAVLGLFKIYGRYAGMAEGMYWGMLVLGMALVQLVLMFIYLWHKGKMRLYKEAKRWYEEKRIFEQCCEEVKNSFLIKYNEPLSVRTEAKKWELWEKKLKGVADIRSRKAGGIRENIRYGFALKETKYLQIVMVILILQWCICLLLF